MSVVTNNILKLLSDLSAASDSIVEENASELSRVSEWGAIIKNKADSIVESGSPSSVSGELPSLTSFLKGRTRRAPRVSTVLTEIQVSHLHGKKGKRASIKARKSQKSSIKTPLRRKSSIKTPLQRKSSIKTPLRRKSNLKDKNETIIIDSEEDTPNGSTPEIIDKVGFVLDQNASTSTSSVERKKEIPLGSLKKTSVYGKGTTSKMDRSSKRKSSSELVGELKNVKKVKINEQLSDPKERDKSLQNTKLEKLKKAKNSSLLPNSAIKSSVGTNGCVAILKENRALRSKMDTKQEKAVENRKNILALRQQKLEQNKRIREEKLEKTLQQRLKLEKEKISKLKSGGGREKTLKTFNKEETPKANVENETLGRTSSSGKNKEKQALKKMKTREILKKAGTSVLKSNEKTPTNIKNPKYETEKIMNTTYVQPSTSGKKGNTLKDPNIGINLGNTKDVPNDNKIQTKPVPKPTKPFLNEDKNQPISTPVQRKGPESYAITPARSSFVSYDISEIRSDSEDEEQTSNSKPIPSWATGVRLRNTLLQQHHHPIDTDELFGNFFDPPDLAAIMGVKKKYYNKRTSSAVWNTSFA